jgi:hypothetical protein
MNGIVSSVENHGSIVIGWIDLEDGGSEPVYMDHRAFGWLVEGEGIKSVGDLIGRLVSYNGESIEFLDNVEVA